MNVIPQPVNRLAPRLTMDLVADFTCPWSFLGLRRVGRALGNLYGLPAPPLVRWHGFRLPRSTGAGGVAEWRAYLSSRLPAHVAPDLVEKSLAEAGRELDIDFDFAAITGVPDTTLAHRLTLLAAREGLVGPVVDAIFRAYFEQGLDIGKVEVLQEIGRGMGVSSASLDTLSISDDSTAVVNAEEQRLRALGVINVPNVLLNGHVLVPGAADVDTYVLALDQALFPQPAADEEAGEVAPAPRLH